MRNNSVKLFLICTSGSGDIVSKISNLELWRPSRLLFGGAEPFMHFGRGHFGEHLCEIILIWTSVLGEVIQRKSLRMTDDRSQ